MTIDEMEKHAYVAWEMTTGVSRGTKTKNTYLHRGEIKEM